MSECEQCLKKKTFKVCSICKIEKAISTDFQLSKGKPRSECKTCRKVKQAEVYQKRKNKTDRITCQCGGHYRERTQKDHLKTAKHKKYIDSLVEIIPHD